MHGDEDINRGMLLHLLYDLCTIHCYKQQRQPSSPRAASASDQLEPSQDVSHYDSQQQQGGDVSGSPPSDQSSGTGTTTTPTYCPAAGSSLVGVDEQLVARVLSLLGDTVVHILPSMNPDGGFADPPTRVNANQVSEGRDLGQDRVNPMLGT
jgi:hypothetical protein